MSDTPPRHDAELLLDSLQTVVLVLDADDRIRACNQAAEQLLGQSRRRLLDTPLSRWLPATPELAALLDRARSQQRSLHGEAFALHWPGRDPHWLEATVTPTADGGVLLEAQLRDESHRLAADAERARQQSEFHAVMQKLAHELKNPLAGVRGAAQLLQRSLSDADRECTDLILREVDRLRGLTDRILLPVRARERLPVNLHGQMEDALALLASAQTAGHSPAVRVERDYDPSLPDLPAHADALQQVFLNLLQNAAEAAGAGASGAEGIVRIRTRAEHGVPVAGKRVRLALRVDISDNGPGVDAALADRLFLPQVSDKPGGSGLGLAIVQSIVQQHDGRVEMRREDGWTVFTVWLPVPRTGGSGENK